MTASRCSRRVNSSASQAVAATNSTETPTKVPQRSSKNCAGSGNVRVRKSARAVKQNAPHQDAPAPQQIDQITAQQAEDAARNRRNIKENSHPLIENRGPGVRRQHFGERGPHDQRENQKRVRIERKTDGGHRTDQPFGGGHAPEADLRRSPRGLRGFDWV